MLLIVHLILIGILGSFCIYYNLKDDSYHSSDIAFATGLPAVLLTALLIVIICVSYGNYVELRTYLDGHVLQHDLKALEAVSGTIDNDDNLIAENKDGYYEGLVEGIFKAKERINIYNVGISSKNILANNFFIGLYIVEPDEDMKIIDVEKYNYNLGE